MVASLFVLAVLAVPPGIDRTHIPSGNPLGQVPIVISPGETPQQLRLPMTEEQWWAGRRALLAREAKTPRMRAIARRLAEIERQEANDPH